MTVESSSVAGVPRFAFTSRTSQVMNINTDNEQFTQSHAENEDKTPNMGTGDKSFQIPVYRERKGYQWYVCERLWRQQCLRKLIW